MKEKNKVITGLNDKYFKILKEVCKENNKSIGRFVKDLLIDCLDEFKEVKKENENKKQ